MAGNRELKVTIIGDASSVKKAFTETGGAASKLRTKIKQTFSPAVMTAGFAAGGAAAVGFAASSIKAFAEAEASQAKLTEAFRKFPQLAGANAEGLRRLNSELAKKTVYDDDITAAAQAQLATFGLTEDQIRKLTPLLQDYASKTGKDLVAAATDLGKATDGTGRALKNVGLDLDLTGTKSQNFEVLVDGLRSKVGGFAEVEGRSATGRLEILRNRFGELQEMIGEKLLPTLIALTEWLTKSGIPSVERFFERMARGWDVWGARVEAAGTNIKNWVRNVGGFFLEIGERIDWLIEKINQLINVIPKIPKIPDPLGLLGNDANLNKRGSPDTANIGRGWGGSNGSGFRTSSINVTNYNYGVSSERQTTNQSLRDAAFLVGV